MKALCVQIYLGFIGGFLESVLHDVFPSHKQNKISECWQKVGGEPHPAMPVHLHTLQPGPADSWQHVSAPRHMVQCCTLRRNLLIVLV